MKRFEIAAGSYNGLTRDKWNEIKDFVPSRDDVVVRNDELERLTRIVFAPGIDGNPTSDIAYYLSCGDAGFKEYMKNMLLKEHEGDVASDDPEVAEKLVKSNLMTFEEYFHHMDAYIHEQMKGKEK